MATKACKYIRFVLSFRSFDYKNVSRAYVNECLYVCLVSESRNSRCTWKSKGVATEEKEMNCFIIRWLNAVMQSSMIPLWHIRMSNFLCAEVFLGSLRGIVHSRAGSGFFLTHGENRMLLQSETSDLTLALNSFNYLLEGRLRLLALDDRQYYAAVEQYGRRWV